MSSSASGKFSNNQSGCLLFVNAEVKAAFWRHMRVFRHVYSDVHDLILIMIQISRRFSLGCFKIVGSYCSFKADLIFKTFSSSHKFKTKNQLQINVVHMIFYSFLLFQRLLQRFLGSWQITMKGVCLQWKNSSFLMWGKAGSQHSVDTEQYFVSNKTKSITWHIVTIGQYF